MNELGGGLRMPLCNTVQCYWQWRGCLIQSGWQNIGIMITGAPAGAIYLSLRSPANGLPYNLILAASET